MLFRTEIPIRQQRLFGFDTKFVSFGSCFADSMAQRLAEHRFEVCANPFGVLYNPISIAQNMERLLDGGAYSESELFEHNGLWHSWAHHGAFSDGDRRAALDKINAAYDEARRRLLSCDVLLITFGSSWVYEFDGRVVANCHKVPNNRFVRRRLAVDEVVDRYVQLIARLLLRRPAIKIIFSVSPIRYLGYDGLENQTNKAVLLLAVEAICQRCACANYFPAYEIVLDELRDYRFFADDMVHPANSAVRYVWERFAQCFMKNEVLDKFAEIEKENKRQSHKLLHAAN